MGDQVLQFQGAVQIGQTKEIWSHSIQLPLLLILLQSPAVPPALLPQLSGQ